MDIITGEEFGRYLGKAFYDDWTRGAWNRFKTSFVTGPNSGKLSAFARQVSALLSKTDGSVLLVEQTGVFQPIENMYLAEMLRKALGETRPIKEAPAHVFSQNDSVVFWTILQVSLLNLWDFLVVSGDRQICIHGSHDEYVDIFALTESSFSEIRGLILPFDFKEFSPVRVT